MNKEIPISVLKLKALKLYIQCENIKKYFKIDKVKTMHFRVLIKIKIFSGYIAN